MSKILDLSSDAWLGVWCAVMVGLLVVVICACTPEGQSAKRFQQIEKLSQSSWLVEDTATGDLWIYSLGGFGTDRWQRVDSR